MSTSKTKKITFKFKILTLIWQRSEHFNYERVTRANFVKFAWPYVKKNFENTNTYLLSKTFITCWDPGLLGSLPSTTLGNNMSTLNCQIIVTISLTWYLEVQNDPSIFSAITLYFFFLIRVKMHRCVLFFWPLVTVVFLFHRKYVTCVLREHVFKDPFNLVTQTYEKCIFLTPNQQTQEHVTRGPKLKRAPQYCKWHFWNSKQFFFSN